MSGQTNDMDDARSLSQSSLVEKDSEHVPTVDALHNAIASSSKNNDHEIRKRKKGKKKKIDHTQVLGLPPTVIDAQESVESGGTTVEHVIPNLGGDGNMGFAGNFLIQGGEFVGNKNIIINSDRVGFKRLQQHVAPSALHDSAQRVEPSRCHPGTREEIILRIFDWIKQSDHRKEWILWLNGAAGAGKSAIMQSFAELCAKEGIPLASFFFFRTDPKRNNMALLVATLVYQLIQTIPETQDYVVGIIERDPLIFEASIEFQLRELLINPLLDCKMALTTLINVLGNIFQSKPIPLVFVIASRHDPHIEMSFGKGDVSDILLTIPLDDYTKSLEDIRLYLDDKFAELTEIHPLRRNLPKSWPGIQLIDTIVDKSSGQFIYASVIMSYISSPMDLPSRRLEIINNLALIDTSVTEHPFANLDALYRYIFSQVKDVEKALQILAFPLLAKESSIDVIGWTFQSGPGLVEVSLMDLTSVITFKDEPPIIRFLHASFGEFLLDKIRSEKYHISSKHSANLACMLLQLIPTEPERELRRTALLNSLLATIHPTEELHGGLLKLHECLLDYHVAFHAVDEDPLQTCIDFLTHFDRLEFGEQRQVYDHFAAIFAHHIADRWPTTEEKKKMTYDWRHILLSNVVVISIIFSFAAVVTAYFSLKYMTT
ncbi:hypothetical protein BJ912DRAFT_960451 [Pholiota molesta]|nr:hypothetical protein BJ912DRAFT_960451 [Pholiota molesta]